jgi:hypothetical protein
MIGRIAATSTLAACLFFPPDAGAQANMTFIPSVSFGAVYDGNIFARTEGSAGQMLQVRPSFEGNYESPTLTLLGLYSFDMQRSNFSLLNTLDARRHALGTIKLRTSPMTTLGLETRYDRTETPGEIDLDTGILGERRQAERLQVTPSLNRRIAPRMLMSAAYDFTTENLIEDARGMLHVARAGLSREWSTRATLSASYVGRYFVDGFDHHTSHAAVVGWHTLLAPGTRFELRAGPRMTTYRGIVPEVAAGFGRTTNRIRLALDYWHGETIVLGIRGPVAVDGGTARVTWPLTRTVEFGTHAGISDVTTLDQREARIYRGTLVSSWTPGGRDGLFTIAGSYGIDYQVGDIRRTLFAEDRVRRHVFRLTMTVAPRWSRSILPPEEAARAKGVSR